MRKSYLFGAMASGLLLTACSSDAPLGPDDNGVATSDQTLYVRMAIHGSDLTRSAGQDGTPVEGIDFETGTPDESKVNNAYFVFYDGDGNVVGDIVSVELKDPKPGTSGTVEYFYENVVPVSVNKSQPLPTQVICYINPLTPAALKSDLNTIQTVTRSEVTSANGFPMSNSVYFSSTASAKPELTVSVKDNLADTPEAAAAMPAVDIYVERYASKLKFTSTQAETYETHTVMNGTTTEIPVELDFETYRWALNAEATSTYVVKSFRQPSETGQLLPDNYSYAQLNAVINRDGGDWTWNAPTFHRSYWAISPAYFTETYPEIADDLDETTWGGQQKYYSLADLKAGAGFEGTDVNAKYFRETTVGMRALESKNARAAIPSVILTGYYNIKVNGTAAPAKSSFYTYMRGSDNKPLVYFAANAQGNSAVTGGESMLNRFFSALTILFKKNADGTFSRFDPTNEADRAVLLANLTIADPQFEDVQVAARLRTLQFVPSPNTSGIYIAYGNGYQTIGDGVGEVTLADANKMIFQQVGTAAFYENGAGYFNIPVVHYGWYREANSDNAALGATGNINWDNVRVGDFGMVRNHSYQLNVTKITGLATGIGGETDPIIPPADTKDQYVSYRVNILKWAVVPTQNVELN